MKKILSILCAVLIASTMSAKQYEHSIGMVAGLGLGIQYKYMKTTHFTIIEEFGYFMNLDGVNGGYSGAINNLVLAYQGKAKSGQGIDLNWYVGGQMKGGYGQGTIGVAGFGAAAGIEADMKNAPIAFSFDFRPGYACIFGSAWGGGLAAAHLFDYSFNLGVRYTIPKGKSKKK